MFWRFGNIWNLSQHSHVIYLGVQSMPVDLEGGIYVEHTKLDLHVYALNLCVHVDFIQHTNTD